MKTMRWAMGWVGVLAVAVSGWGQSAAGVRSYVGFDRNEYPGDAALAGLRRQFAFAGYWLTNPPGETSNSWVGKREVLVKQGYGFLVLANGRTDAEILATGKTRRLQPEALGGRDGAAAVAAARREHFPAGTIIFLDQEEGGRLLGEQGGYLKGWVAGVKAGGYGAGIYLSGQAVEDGPGRTITTAQDVQARVASGSLPAVTLWVYQDACPPSNGCTLRPKGIGSSGTSGAVVWQYAQSPRRPENTAACVRTYAADGNCYAPGMTGVLLDLNVAGEADPSHGR